MIVKNIYIHIKIFGSWRGFPKTLKYSYKTLTQSIMYFQCKNEKVTCHWLDGEVRRAPYTSIIIDIVIIIDQENCNDGAVSYPVNSWLHKSSIVKY